MSQKVVQYQAVMQMAAQNPQIYDLPELNKQMLEVLGIKNIGKLIPSAEDQKPKDPVSENMAIINGKPVKAFIYQDHQAHIQVHMAALQDPMMAQLIGQNPQAQQIQASAMAHINEHIAFEYRKQIEEQLGVELPKPGEELPEDVEVQLSRLTAAAASKLLQKNQAQVQQQQAEQQMQDPLIQIQMKELEIKEREVKLKEMKTEADIVNDTKRVEIEAAKVESSERVAGANLGSKSTLEKEKIVGDQMATGFKLGLEATKQAKEPKQQEKKSTKE